MKGYKICVRSAMCHGAKSCAIRVESKNRLQTTENEMLQIICGKTLKDKIRSGCD